MPIVSSIGVCLNQPYDQDDNEVSILQIMLTLGHLKNTNLIGQKYISTRKVNLSSEVQI